MTPPLHPHLPATLPEEDCWPCASTYIHTYIHIHTHTYMLSSYDCILTGGGLGGTAEGTPPNTRYIEREGE